MLIVVDIGNTRTKWAQVKPDGSLGEMHAVLHAEMATSTLKDSLSQANKVMVANVAGDEVAQQLSQMVPKGVELLFAQVSAEAAQVVNQYDQASLGIDRWAAAVAAWHVCQQPVIVVNAGTAITIDSLSRDKLTKKGIYLGGSIMPSLRLMYQSLTENTSQLPSAGTGNFSIFPGNTQDAIQTGCINAIVGAVVLQLKHLEKYCAFLPKVVISGGDAVKIAEALNSELKRAVVEEDLVLQGLVLLEKETV